MENRKRKEFSGIVYSTNRDFNYQYQEEKSQERITNEKQNLRIQLDKKQRAGKSVTLISGFIGLQEDLITLGKELKQKCGVGGTVKEGEIIIQGDFREKIYDLLIKEGYKVKKVGGN